MSRTQLTFDLSGSNSVDYLDQAQAQLGVAARHHERESTVELPSWFGSGTLRRLELREGVELFVGDMQPCAPLTLAWNLELHEPILELHFQLDGTATTIFDGDRDQYTLTGGQVGHSYLAAARFSGRSLYPAQQRQRMVELTLHAPAFAQSSALATLLPAAATLACLEKQFLNRCMLPEVRLVVQHILQCSFVGSARLLYLEAKALELLALALATTTYPCANCTCIRTTDLERIHAARDLLLARMDAPPSLLELARSVGLNDFKLKTGFKQVFGTTVFGYLHEQRMQRARVLLLEGRQNVLDVALSVGYASPSRFAAAFKQMFGMLPSAVQRANSQGCVEYV